jgi:hypothetical protein
MVQNPADEKELRVFHDLVDRTLANKRIAAVDGLDLIVTEARRVSALSESPRLALLLLIVVRNWMGAWSAHRLEPENSPRRNSAMRVLTHAECAAVGQYCARLFVENVRATIPYEMVRVQASLRMAEYASVVNETDFARSLFVATETRWVELLSAQPDDSPMTEGILYELERVHSLLFPGRLWQGGSIATELSSRTHDNYRHDVMFGALDVSDFPRSWRRDGRKYL